MPADGTSPPEPGGGAQPPPGSGDVADPPSAPLLYLDVGHPESLLAAERALQVMPVATEWIPVHLGPPAMIDLTVLAELAASRGLQPLKPPAQLPFDAELANLAATFAKSTGRAVAFLQAALRQAYAGARDLSALDNILIAGSACELHPRSLLKALETKGTRRALEQATARARALGVERAPSVVVGGCCFTGDAGLDEAAAFLRERGIVAEPAPAVDVAGLLSVIPPQS